MKTTSWQGAIALGMAAVLAGCAHAPSPRPITSAASLETFEAAHRMVSETHFDTTFNGVDWKAVGTELRPRAARARTREELRGVIRDMIRRLGQSHFALIPEEAADALDPADTVAVERVGEVGMDVRLVGEQVLVTGISPRGPADLAGIRPGWVVQSVDGDLVKQVLRAARRSQRLTSTAMRVRDRVTARLNGTAGSTCVVDFLDDRDRRVRVPLVRERARGEAVRFGNLPTFFARLESRTLETPEPGVSAGLIRFNVWMVPVVRRFDEALDPLRSLDGIVIDLRGNPGGVGMTVSGIAGHFFDDERLLGTFRTRDLDLLMKASPREIDAAGRAVAPYGGPVAILTDRMTGSASEVFAAGMQAVGRARVFGDTTAGGVLPARMDRLPNRDVLFHAFAEFVTARGEHLEGRGVAPDERVPLGRADLLAGRDPALDAALRWIAEQHRNVTHQTHAEEE